VPAELKGGRLVQDEVKAPDSAGPLEGTKAVLRQPRVRLGAVVALAAAAGIIAWVAIGDGDNSSSTPATKGPVAAGHAAAGLSASGLRTLAGKVKQQIYWDGTKRGYLYELTRLNDGRIYVRYLPPGVKVGDKRSKFLIIATYPFPGAFSALQKVSHGKAVKIPGGGIALVHQTYPKSVHVAFPGIDYQIEVYDPSPKRSLEVATSGKVQPVR
jgi:hypothetical protein